MSKQRKRRKSLTAVTPSTPKSKYHIDDNMLATPKTHHIQDDDSDSSPYSLSFSQRAIGVEVTWEEKSRPTPFKSRKIYQRRDTESPPTKTTYVDVEPVATESPKGVYKFLLGWERRRIATQIEDDFERIGDSDDGTFTAQTLNGHSNATTNNDAMEQGDKVDEPTKSSISDSAIYKQLLHDSEDMDLMLCSQRVEQEVCNRSVQLVQQATASKGFSEFFSDNDDDLLLALDDPVIVDKKLPQKSSFARHKSIAIQPNSSTMNGSAPSNLQLGSKAVNVSEPKSGLTVKQPSSNRNAPSTPTTTSSAPVLVRHKSMPSPNVSNLAKKCSAEETEIKRRNAIAKLKLRKQRLLKK